MSEAFFRRLEPLPQCVQPEVQVWVVCAPSAPQCSICRGRRYKCATCKRFVPWCCGADDEYPDDCDDCAVAKMRAADD